MDFLKPSVMRKHGWLPPPLVYGFPITEEHIVKIRNKHKQSITFPPDRLNTIAPVDIPRTIRAIFKYLKATHGLPSMQELVWEGICMSPTNNCDSIIGLALSHENDGKLPSEEDMRKVVEFFAQTAALDGISNLTRGFGHDFGVSVVCDRMMGRLTDNYAAV